MCAYGNNTRGMKVFHLHFHFKLSAKYWSEGKTQNEPPFLSIMYTRRKEEERESIIDKAIGAGQFQIKSPLSGLHYYNLLR